MKQIRVGIVGTGFGASVHAPILQLHEGFDVKAIASMYRGKVQDVQRSTGIQRVYTDWRGMIDQEELDLVVVASAPPNHHDMTMVALRKGLHVLCEKPLGMNAVETKAMLEQQQLSDVRGFVHFQWRLAPVRQAIKQVIQSGKLGRILHMKYQGSFSGYSMLTNQSRGWEGSKSAGGGMLFAIGSHMIDALQWWMDEQISDVYADLSTKVPTHNSASDERTEHRDADDAFSVIGHFEQGASFVMDLLFSGVRGNGWCLEVYGTEGTLRMTNDTDVEVSEGGAFEQIVLSVCEPPLGLAASAVPYYSGLNPMLNGVYQSIVEGKTASDIPTFVDGHRVQLVLDAIQQSAEQQRKVVIS
ncbi:Gfo/Idh/MocA family protein [Paenibacillus arenosi]|uniref:Gfo/Idh/MocA family oxidoreductase n=1 Tax=Paenibacillus arenosi TaxID=2774142 RepID=A0ABR9AYN5_9BACL|nr:Gfo/Idh/MocA family oxidoreductase [Paenibacillus arenosi]MBD8499001.1 Gfo/Idh/MocA family oxidoreductase [Paenibacillus arenosi]